MPCTPYRPDTPVTLRVASQDVDDILLIVESNNTNIQAVLTDINYITPNLHFTAQSEQNNTINYLDISI